MKKSNLVACGAFLLALALGGTCAFAKVSSVRQDTETSPAAAETESVDSAKVYVPYAAQADVKREHTVGSGSVSFARTAVPVNRTEDPNFSANFSSAVKEAMKTTAQTNRVTFNQSTRKLVQQRWEHLAVNR